MYENVRKTVLDPFQPLLLFTRTAFMDLETLLYCSYLSCFQFTRRQLACWCRTRYDDFIMTNSFPDKPLSLCTQLYHGYASSWHPAYSVYFRPLRKVSFPYSLATHFLQTIPPTMTVTSTALSKSDYRMYIAISSPLIIIQPLQQVSPHLDYAPLFLDIALHASIKLLIWFIASKKVLLSFSSDSHCLCYLYICTFSLPTIRITAHCDSPSQNTPATSLYSAPLRVSIGTSFFKQICSGIPCQSLSLKPAYAFCDLSVPTSQGVF